MIDALFLQEMTQNSRRLRGYWLRWLYGGWLLLLACGMLLGHARHPLVLDHRMWAAFSRHYLDFFFAQHFLLLTLLTPVVVGGAVTDEKVRGTLQHLLIAETTPGALICGKLLSRGYQLLVLALPGLPLLCMIGGLGDLDVFMLLSFIVLTLLAIYTIGAASLLASVWCRHTRDAVLGLYAIAVLGSIALGVLDQLLPPPLQMSWLHRAMDLLRPLASETFEVRFWQLARALLLWGGVGTVLLILAVLRLRPAYIRQLENQGKPPRWWRRKVRRPAVWEEHPLWWKERHVEGIAPLAFLRRIPRWVGILGVSGATAASNFSLLVAYLPVGVSTPAFLRMLVTLDFESLASVAAGLHDATGAMIVQGVLVLLISALVMGVRCSGAVTGERERQTWEALLLTPLETRELIRGKAWGIVGAGVPYLLAYLVPAVLFALLFGALPLFVILLWFGLTVLALFYVAACGLWCSVRSRTSWGSLLGTLAATYVGGLCMTPGFCCFAFMLFKIIVASLAILDSYLQTDFAATADQHAFAFQVVFCFLMAAGFLLASVFMLRRAEYLVSILERTKHWHNELPMLKLAQPSARNNYTRP